MDFTRVLPLALLLTNCAAQDAATPPPSMPTGAAPTPATSAATNTSAPQSVAPPTMPEAIAIPSGQKVLLKAVGKGVQIYVCKAKEGAASLYEWTLKAPEAELFDDNGRVIGKHYGGPTWESTDGSKVVGKLHAKADAPEATAIPWLLLDAKSNEGSGVFSSVKGIQRVATVGGKAPAGGCDGAHTDAETRVAYGATYYMYGP
ncbi:MAG: DUF3455 domain-containing protein [Myxococcota bacterium]|nr:DUF3455 domain-containing protein [Myxococcota bacterium]